MAVSSQPAHSCRNTGIEHLPGARVQAEGDVGDAQGEVDARVSFLDPPDGLDCLDAVAAHLLLPGRDREGEGIDDDVLLRQPPVVGDLW